ncbi:branched-chain amino acid ABC transporter permease [Xanthobacteraceae bacterium A53D]
MTTALQILFSGLTVGSIYALVAIGFALIYNSSSVINFAQGEFVMLGGMITVAAIAAGLPTPLAIMVAIMLTVAIGYLSYLAAVKPAVDASPVVIIIITIGVSIFLRGMTAVILGKDFHSFPPLFSASTVDVAGAQLQTQAIAVVAGGAMLVIFVWLFLKLTAVGRAVRATAANALAARLVGVNTSMIVGLTFALSAFIGAVGGVLVTPITLTSWDGGTLLSIKGFGAAMLGGLAHPAGPVIGGFIIGIVEAFGAGYVSSQYKDVLAFLVLLGMLFLRPEGLLAPKSVERV